MEWLIKSKIFQKKFWDVLANNNARNEDKKRFFANLIHDMRSPLLAEQKTLEVILSGKLGTSLSDFSEYLNDIYKTNEELLHIINSILSSYHYESGKIELTLDNINISELIDTSIKLINSLANDAEAQINTDIDAGLPSIFADRDEIIRVVINLITNAIKHNPKGTNINISATKTNKEIQIAVQDNGKGISESEKPTIFKKYPTVKRKIGTGLGLYLSKQIIKAHKGRIWFESEEDKGTTFYFTLPVS